MDQAVDTVSGWVGGESDEAAPGPGGAPAQQPAPTGESGGEKSWWEETANTVSDWLSPGDDNAAAPGPSQEGGPSAEGAEGMPAPVAEPEAEESGFVEDIYDWLSPVAAGGEKAAGTAGEAAGGAWDDILAEIEKKKKEQAIMKCKVHAGQKYQWCVMDYTPADCAKKARIPETDAAGAPLVDAKKYRACIGEHGTGCWDFAIALSKECLDRQGLKGNPGVAYPGVQP